MLKITKDRVEELTKEVKKDPSVCSICFDYYDGFGNNAQPINEGRCCDNCNYLVIVARMRCSVKK